MNSREIVLRTLDYENPERVAQSFSDSDLLFTFATTKTYATEWKEKGDGSWEHVDEWGNVWRRIDPTSKGEVAKGVLDDINDIPDYRFPDFSRPEDYDSARELRDTYPDKWLMGAMPGFTFNIARKMRKLEQYLVDILAERELIHLLHDRIDIILEDMIRNFAAAGMDCVMFPEDWGTQAQTLVNPGLWREEFFPRFEKLCGLAHSCGIKVFMHSCGMITDIVPGLMESGIDLLQFDQPELHGLDTLAQHQERGKITFWCPVDIQKVLPTGDEKLIRDKAREMLDKLWKGRGGFIAGFYSDEVSIGLNPRWQQIANEEFLKQGKQENYSK
jgi:hypothetical protein